MADFATIKASVTIAQVLDMLGITGLTATGDTMRSACPICKEGNNRAFVVTPARNIYYCFSEKKGGSVIDLVARFKRITEAEAGRHIAQYFGLNGTSTGSGNAANTAPTASEVPQERKPAGFDPREYQRSLDPAHAALKDCGVPEQTIRDFDGGYCAKGLNRGRLTLPVHSPTGELLAFMGIALKGEQPDLLFPKGFKPPPFFNIHRQTTGGSLILVHTPMDVLRAWDNGLQDAICPLVPLEPGPLDFLAAFMREKERTELEWY